MVARFLSTLFILIDGLLAFSGSEILCPVNEVYTECVISCNDCATRGNCTQRVCYSDCDCIEGFHRNNEDKCVPVELCEGNTCPANEEYSECKTPCDDCINRGQCQPEVCRVGCHCSLGYFRNESGTCTPEDQCLWRGRRWGDIAYSFLAGGDGRIYEGRGWRRVGAHTINYNFKSIALCFLGNFQTYLPNPAMYRRIIINFINYGISRGHIATNYQLHGHRDASCTDCPGTALYNEVKKLRNFRGGRLPGYNC